MADDDTDKNESMVELLKNGIFPEDETKAHLLTLGGKARIGFVPWMQDGCWYDADGISVIHDHKQETTEEGKEPETCTAAILWGLELSEASRKAWGDPIFTRMYAQELNDKALVDPLFSAYHDTSESPAVWRQEPDLDDKVCCAFIVADGFVWGGHANFSLLPGSSRDGKMPFAALLEFTAHLPGVYQDLREDEGFEPRGPTPDTAKWYWEHLRDSAAIATLSDTREHAGLPTTQTA